MIEGEKDGYLEGDEDGEYVGDEVGEEVAIFHVLGTVEGVLDSNIDGASLRLTVGAEVCDTYRTFQVRVSLSTIERVFACIRRTLPITLILLNPSRN